MTTINPGTWVLISNDGEKLHRGDMGTVFTIERGKNPPLYGVYCYDKEIWEYFEKEQLMPK